MINGRAIRYGITQLMNFSGRATPDFFINKICFPAEIILAFHDIVPPQQSTSIETKNLEHSISQIENVINTCKKVGYKFVPLAELIENESDEKRASLTFDDASIGWHLNLPKLIREYQVPVTLFLTSGFIDGTSTNWWYSLDSENKDKKPFKRIPKLARIDQAIITQPSNHVSGKTQLNWKQVKVLSELPEITIGGHGRNHRVLSKLNLSELRTEIIQDKSRIESKLDLNLEYFAFPYGGKNDISAQSIFELKEVGYTKAFTTFLDAKAGEPFLVSRYSVSGHMNCENDLLLYISTAYSINKLKSKIGKDFQHLLNSFTRR
jgi:peptidoglycan/xylan/chitin deacetylase (PgdA/CDA1 family)